MLGFPEIVSGLSLDDGSIVSQASELGGEHSRQIRWGGAFTFSCRQDEKPPFLQILGLSLPDVKQPLGLQVSFFIEEEGHSRGLHQDT